MTESRLFSSETKGLLLKCLGLSSMEELWTREYKDLTLDDDVNRESVAKYSIRARGSVRLFSGRYYTLVEYNDRIDRINNLRLP